MSERRDHMGTLAPADDAALLADGTVAGRWVLDPAPWIEALRHSHDRLRAVAAPLGLSQLQRPLTRSPRRRR